MPVAKSDAHDYAFLDCGGHRKLERFGEITLVRPCPTAVWPPKLSKEVWEKAHAEFIRKPAGGEWQKNAALPETWKISWGVVQLYLRLAAGGQVGVFPEQADNWEWVHRLVCAARAKTSQPPAILNCFAYTGAATLWSAAAGAQVCHVDGARSNVTWARRNAALSGLAECPIRWIVEDVYRFLGRERRRGRRYEGIILDPPAFGRGPGGRVWFLARDLPLLLEAAASLLSEYCLFMIISCHAPALSAEKLAEMMRGCLGGKEGKLEAGEMVIASCAGGCSLPCGCFARWRSSCVTSL
mgnify:CR=1 FL=1